jgi:hypothetical protein
MADNPTPGQPGSKQVKQHAEGTGTENIIRRHLEDPNHVITDEEIKNVVVGKSDDDISLTGAEVTARFGIDEEESKETPGADEKNKENPEFKPPNPWDVLK